MNQDEALGIFPPSKAQRCLLRRSLPGEYFSLALMLHAGLGSVVWAASVGRAPSNLLIVAAGVWIVGRAAGAFAQRGFTPLATVGLLVAALIWGRQEFDPPAVILTIFSLPVFIAMLGAVLLLDVVELAFSPAVSRRLRSWNWHRIAIGAFASVFLVYMVIVPTASWVIEAMRPPGAALQAVEDLSLAEKVRLRSMEAMTALWFFALGATIGSFLNVVVYRMPRGESVVFRRSSCPQCGASIQGRDNIPIFGWLLLNGRCRACRTPISSRYPIVELITAAIFLLAYFVELISGGANIPVRKPNTYSGVVWVIFYTKWDLVGLYLFHCFSLSALLTWALIDVDRQRIRTDDSSGTDDSPEESSLKDKLSEDASQATRIPWRARLGVGAILCGLPFWRRFLLPVPWLQKEAFEFNAPEWLILGTGVIGGLVGALLGWFAVLAISRRIDHRAKNEEEPIETSSPPGSHTVSAGMIVGLSVGWQAAMGVWLLAFAIRPITHFAARRWSFNEPPMTATLLAAYLIHLVCWRWLTIGWWPSYTTTPIAWVAVCVGMASLWWVNWRAPVFRRKIIQPL